MSNLRVQGNATGTGTFTIAAPSGNTDRTLTLPDEAGTLLTTTGDGSGLTGISSYTDSDALSLFNATGSAPVYSCRAWVNFNGQGTVAIRASGNVSSITDLGVGVYQVNFTIAMPDSDYSAAGLAQNAGSNGSNISLPSAPLATTSLTFFTVGQSSNANNDPATVLIAVFR